MGDRQERSHRGGGICSERWRPRSPRKVQTVAPTLGVLGLRHSLVRAVVPPPEGAWVRLSGEASELAPPTTRLPSDSPFQPGEMAGRCADHQRHRALNHLSLPPEARPALLRERQAGSDVSLCTRCRPHTVLEPRSTRGVGILRHLLSCRQTLSGLGTGATWLSFYPCTHRSPKCELNACYVPGSVASSGDPELDVTRDVPAPWSL